MVYTSSDGWKIEALGSNVYKSSCDLLMNSLSVTFNLYWILRIIPHKGMCISVSASHCDFHGTKQPEEVGTTRASCPEVCVFHFHAAACNKCSALVIFWLVVFMCGVWNILWLWANTQFCKCSLKNVFLKKLENLKKNVLADVGESTQTQHYTHFI